MHFSPHRGAEEGGDGGGAAAEPPTWRKRGGVCWCLNYVEKPLTIFLVEKLQNIYIVGPKR